MGVRFIPAGAGNTGIMVPSTSWQTVYPRWRGEHSNSGRVEENISGLSPLARGTLRSSLNAVPGRRFIPAGAGNTAPRHQQEARCTVYPRWRGEHFLLRAGSLIHCGLSPLARGTHKQFVVNENLKRFIPAGAGNTETPWCRGMR